MSDSDSDSDYGADWEAVRDKMTAKLMAASTNDTIIALRPSEEVFERWSRIAIETRAEAAQRMKLCAFWLPILLQREECTTTAWALQIGLIDLNDDLSLKHLHKIEVLEAIFRALEKGTLKKDQTKHVIWISNMFNLRSPEVLEDALHWLERTGEPSIRRYIMDLGHPTTCFKALHLIFTEFAKYIQNMGNNLEKTMKALMAQPSDYNKEKSEEMKKKGNENFTKNQYEDAVKFYSKAIKFYPDNHIIYGNRALTYLRSQKYLKAVGDGKRAILIKPLWAKGHYRYCEALFSLGEVKRAIEANKLAQTLCKRDREGVKDLEQQLQKFMGEQAVIQQADGTLTVLEPNRIRTTSTHTVVDLSGLNTGSSLRIGLVKNAPPQTKVLHGKGERKPVKNVKNEKATLAVQSSPKVSKPLKSEVPLKNDKKMPTTKEFSVTAKKKSKNRKRFEDEKLEESKPGVCKQFKTMVQDGYTALADHRSRNAEQAFRQAVEFLENSKELGLSTMDVLLLHFGRVSALTDIGLPEELGQAHRLLEKMKSYELRTFQCLVFYAIGRVYFRENRFAVALKQFSDSLQMVKNQITPG
ncbi:E3 ubiquitin-protein ligase TTC3 [Larimichthys crocea]|uniref:Uncharacterized protein n=1 Tax=Larimichthys crocea TaxID=215358 RepID=A0ACD3R797_LARCR|nr:E3 ubiquitin-protein ligase TTC3 [Larimichthys crocea]